MPTTPSESFSAEPRPGAIFMADDDRVMARLISSRLARIGYEVIAFANGEELLARAATERPAVIILDLMMPVKDGYSTLRALKADPVNADIPVLMLSAKGQEADVVRCLEAGAADYVVKPFSPSELVVRLQKVVLRAS